MVIIGRRVRRAIRRIGRIVERGGRLVGDVTGSIPVVGDVLGATGLVETPLQKQMDKKEEDEKKQQEALNKQIRDQQLEEKWAKEQTQASQQIMGTQQKGITGDGGTDLTTVLSGDIGVEDEEDILKRMIKKRG